MGGGECTGGRGECREGDVGEGREGGECRGGREEGV